MRNMTNDILNEEFETWMCGHDDHKGPRAALREIEPETGGCEMILMKVECRFCDGNGKIHSSGRNGDPMDSGVDCPECGGTGAVDVDCETGDEVEAMPAWLDRKEPSRRTLSLWASDGQ